MSERLEHLLLSNIPQILRMVGGQIDRDSDLAVRNALFAMAGEMTDDRTIEITETEGPTRMEGLSRARQAIQDKLETLPAEKRTSQAGEQLAVCGHALGEIQDSFALALEEGLNAKVNVRRLAEAIESEDSEESGDADGGGEAPADDGASG